VFPQSYPKQHSPNSNSVILPLSAYMCIVDASAQGMMNM